MKLCPTCGEVYPDDAMRCSAHAMPLLDWSEVNDTVTVPRTSVEGEIFADSGTLTRPGDLTDPEVLIHATPTPQLNVVVDPAVVAASPKPMRVLGERYLLGQHIGIGGYGAVFDAYDQRLDKRVAVKVLSPAVAQDENVVRRFKREALAASRVRHECIVDVTDYDIDAAGISFIVMEYLDGFDLSEVLADDGPLLPTRALAIAAQCSSALTAAHASGIIHRDLKPANIFLVRSPSRADFVKIIDFGISKISNADGHFSNVTNASKVVGTPHYMAPEQGKGLPLDGRADVYALGVILFEMLTDQRPFIGTSALEILTNAMTQERVAPSSRRSELAEIPGLDELVLRAISADRAHRFESMQQFGEAIMACLSELDAGLVLSLPTIAFQPERSPAKDEAGAPRVGDETELLSPSTLESSSGELTATHRMDSSRRWAIPGLVGLLVAAALALLWLNRSGANDNGAAESQPPAPTPAAAPGPPAETVAPPGTATAPRPATEPEPPARRAEPPAAPKPSAGPPQHAPATNQAQPAQPKAPKVVKHERASPRPTHHKRVQRPHRSKPRETTKPPAKPTIGIKDW